MAGNSAGGSPGEYGDGGVNLDARDASAEPQPKCSLVIGVGGKYRLILEPVILVNNAAEAAVVIDNYRAATQGGEAEAAVGERGRIVECVLSKVVVSLGGKRDYFLSIIEGEGFGPGGDQNAPVIVRVQE